jgi:hypothetical protein
MYAYIDFARAEKDGKIRKDKLEGWFKFLLDNGREIGGHTTEGRAHIDCKTLPEEVKPYFIHCSERISWEVQAHRYTGVYKLGTATATLELKREIERSYGNEGNFEVNHDYVLDILSETVEDCKEIVRQVRAGTIVPAENWEAPQQLPPQPKPPLRGFGKWLNELLQGSSRTAATQ